MYAVRSLCDRASISGVSSRNLPHSGIFNAMSVRPGRSTACGAGARRSILRGGDVGESSTSLGGESSDDE